MADDRVDMGWRAIGAFLKKWRQKRRKKKDGIGSAAKEPEMWVENPYLPQFRNIMEQVLKKRGISYRDFAPVCIDEEKPELLLMEEDIVTVLHELERDLNALTILTERPDFFSSYAARMEEEYLSAYHLRSIHIQIHRSTVFQVYSYRSMNHPYQAYWTDTRRVRAILPVTN